MKRFLLALMLLAVPVAASSPGTQIACNGGVSPCTISTVALQVLNSNPARSSCIIEAVGAVNLYCKRATLANSTASASNFDFILTGGTALTGGQAYTCDSAYSVWRGPVNCVASASSAVVDLSVAETQ